MELTKDEILNVLNSMKEQSKFPEEQCALSFAVALVESSTFGYWEHIGGDRYDI